MVFCYLYELFWEMHLLFWEFQFWSEKCIKATEKNCNLKQEVEKTQKSAEAGCLKLLSLPNFFFLQWYSTVVCIFFTSIFTSSFICSQAQSTHLTHQTKLWHCCHKNKLLEESMTFVHRSHREGKATQCKHSQSHSHICIVTDKQPLEKQWRLAPCQTCHDENI